MGPAEGGEKVVQGHLVGQVNNGEAQAPLEAIAVEQVVVTHAGVKQVAWGDSLGIVVVVFRPDSRDLDEDRAQAARIASG